MATDFDNLVAANPSLLEAPAGRILVVDDQPTNLQIVGNVLGNLGHEIIPAEDGATALKRVALRPPDLILLDLLMPVTPSSQAGSSCTSVSKRSNWLGKLAWAVMNGSRNLRSPVIT